MDEKDRRVLDIARLQQTQNIDLHGRRIINAGASVHSSDYVTRAEISGTTPGGGVAIGTLDYIPKFTATGLADSKAHMSGPRFIIGSGTSVNPGVLATVKEFVVHSDLAATTTESAMFVQCGAYASSSPADVEKIGILSLIYSADPSNYGLSINRDAVAVDARGISVSGNLFARVWGAYFEGNIASGSEGVANAIEASIVNYGSNQASIDQVTTKVGIALNTRGLNPGTAAVNITPTWNHGIISRADAVNVSFIQLYKTAEFTSLFRVNPTGQTLIGDLPNAATTGTYDPTTYGIAVFRTQITVVDNSSNKNLISIFTDAGSSKHRIIAGHYDTPGSTWPISFEINGTAAQIINTTGASLFGLASTEFSLAYGNVAVKNYVFVTDAIVNSHVAVVATDSGSSSVIFGSDKTGSATLWPIAFQIGTDVWLKLQIDGGVTFKASSAAISSSSQGRMRFNTATNKFQLSENGGAYADIIGSSGITGSGTTGTISKWSSSSALTDSALVEATAITSSKDILPSTDDARDFGDSTHTWHKVWASYIQTNTSVSLRLLAGGAHSVFLGVSGGDVWELTSSGHFMPTANNTYTLGGSSNRPSTVYGVAGDFSGTVTGNLFSGSGASLTALNAANISSGTLAIARGGTNSTSLTSNAVMYFNGTSIVGSSNLTYNATDLVMAAGNMFFPTGHGIAVTGGGGGFAVTSSAAEAYVATSTLALQITTTTTKLLIGGTLYTLSVVAGIVNAA